MRKPLILWFVVSLLSVAFCQARSPGDPFMGPFGMKSIRKMLLPQDITTAIPASDVDPKIPLLLASERNNLPVEGTLLYDCEDLGGYRFSGGAGSTKTIVDADTSLEFGKQFQLKVARAGTNAWEPQFQSPVNAIPVNSGDVLFYVFFIRTTDTESPNDFGKADFYAQKASSPWTGIGSLSMSLSTGWRKLYVAAKSTADFGIGEMEFTIHLGYLQQKVEIGGILALNLGSVDMDDLPTNDVVYDGMDPGAAWRPEAAARIEQYRKSDVTLRILDDDGNVVNDAIVSVQMKDHAFGFGNFISELVLASTGDGDKYRTHMLDMFNVATTPFYMGGNSDDWGWYGTGNSQEVYPEMAEWLQMNDIPAKGHVLVWPGWDWMPSFFEDLAGDSAGLRQAIDDHLETLVPIGKEYGLYQWDVVNEPYINHDVMDILGEEVLVEWYKKVHLLDPFPRLILNEYNIIMGGGDPKFQENFERIISYLQAESAPLGGIGMQCHFDENLPGIPAVLEVLDRFSVFGLPVQVTEFDVAIRDEEMQAQYLRDFYTAVFSHPAADKIVMWGFFEQVMWKPLAALVRSDWSYKPNYHVYKDLLYNQWWTPDTAGISDIRGEFEFRGFNGYYDITFSIDDSSYTIRNLFIEKDTVLELNPKMTDPGTAVPEEVSGDLNLLTGYPNPFKDNVVLTYSLARPAELKFHFYSTRGELVESGTVDHVHPGTHSIEFDLSGLPSGVYMCVVQSDPNLPAIKPLRIIKE